MRYPTLLWLAGVLSLGMVGGCDQEPGTPDYSDQERVPEVVDPFPPVPPDPFEPGDERLSVGYFYEGGWSEEIPINLVNTNYFVFAIDVTEPVATATYSQTDSKDRLEGLISVEITLRDQPFWGGGIIWDEPTDLSDWTTMSVGFKSSDPSFARFDITLQSGEGESPSGVTLDPTDYGYTNDGEWHFLQIPLQDAIDRGWNPSLTRSPFIISADGGDQGDVMLVDNLYFTKEPPSGGTGGTGGAGGTGGIGGTGGTGGSGGTAGTGAIGGGQIVYEQDFESLDPDSAAALSDDGWVFFANVFDSGGTLLFPFGPQPAPNANVSPSDTFISALVSGEGDTPQGDQQLSVFNDYNCCQPNSGHFNGTDRVEVNVFQEIRPESSPITAADIGRTLTFSFDAKRGNIEGATTALAFITTLDPGASFAQTNFVPVDLTGIPATWDRYSVTLELTDPLLEGQILQVGFRNTASNFEGSGIFYDNVEATLSGDSGGPLRPLPEIYTTGNAINYSPYRAQGPAVQPSEMPSDEDVLEDLGLLQTAGYDLLRLFGGDPVSEQILRLAEDNFPEMQFQQGLFLEGLAPGPPQQNCESELNDTQVETAIRLANTYSNVVTVSVGNETSFFSAFMPLTCLEGYITETRNNVTQPVTADDDYTFYAGISRMPDTILPLIDFVAIHMYPITNYRQWDWRQEGVEAGPLRAEAMMNEAFAVAQANYQAVYDYQYMDASGATVTIGESLPIVVGETGWKWRQTNLAQEIETYAANPVNAKWYYDLMLGWERTPGGPPTIFIFNSFDETWKTTDDGWGFWDEFRMPLYVLCDTPAGSACNDPIYQGAGFFP